LETSLLTLLRALGCAALLLTAAPAAAQSLPASQTADPYFTGGRAALDRALARRPNTGRAKNVILFVGDGMGVSTVTAARIFEGQARGVDGESNVLSFEALPHVALSKTYSTSTQVADSAATATALMTGVKTRTLLLGVGPCDAAVRLRIGPREHAGDPGRDGARAGQGGRRGHHYPADARHPRRDLRPRRPARVGGRCRHAGRRSRRGLRRHRAPAGRGARGARV
jgi:hypothetical protein